MFYDRIVFDVCYIYCVIGNVLIYLCVLLLFIVLFIDLIMIIEGKKNNNYIVYNFYVVCNMCCICR